MKKLIVLMVSIFLLQSLSLGQANAPIGQTVQFTSATVAGPVMDMTSNLAGITQHVFSWVVTGTVSAGAIKLQQSSTPTFASPSDCIIAQTVTSSGGPTSVAACTAPYFRLFPSTALVGTGTVTVRYLGFTANSNSTVRTTPAATGFTTDYNSGLFSPKQTTDTVVNQTVTAVPTLATTILFNNTTTSGATVTAGDGTSNILTAFNIPGNSQLVISTPGGLALGKVVISQGTTGSLIGYIGGKQ